ncbi:MAG TPA: hypothetical protein VL988_02130 [Solirubrobacteraceae bacterium]|nr:hypothetical protein [Solirubrobacteraceae bacterium]
MTNLRSVRRPRRYVAKHWIVLLRPLFGYNFTRDAYLIRGIGRRVGPVLRAERRLHRERDRRPWVERAWRELPEGLEGDSVDRRWVGA